MTPRILLPCTMVALISGCVLPRFDVGPTYLPPTSTRSLGNGLHDYRYIATPARREQIVNGFGNLKVGQTREEVRAAMGPPDLADAQYSLELFPKYEGWRYHYYIRLLALGPNFRDEYVGAYFKPDGKLKWAVASNIPGLTEVGSCGRPFVPLPPVESTTQPE